MCVLIFGVNGQDGYYLSRLCEHEGCEVIGVSRTEGSVLGDVADRELVVDLIRQHEPDFVFHLAARSSTRLNAAFENHATIGTGSLNILEAVHAHSPRTRVFLAGSGLQFRNPGTPICEEDPFEAANPYAATRIYATYLARYFRRLGVRVYFGYLFHHESPRRKPGHLSRMIADAARKAGRGEAARLEVGDLTVEKEWTFAGDIVAAMWKLVNQDKLYEANLGTGIARSVEDWVRSCFDVVGLDWRDYVSRKEGFQAEYPRLVSNPARIHSLGWQPRVDLAELAGMMVGHDERPIEPQALV